LRIDISTVDTVDQRILQKHVANDSGIKAVRQIHQRHKYDQIQLQKHILTAQQQMQDLTAWATSAEQHMGGQQWKLYVTIIGMVLLIGCFGGLAIWLFKRVSGWDNTGEDGDSSTEDAVSVHVSIGTYNIRTYGTSV
jgi:hypothetical protein